MITTFSLKAYEFVTVYFYSKCFTSTDSGFLVLLNPLIKAHLGKLECQQMMFVGTFAVFL